MTSLTRTALVAWAFAVASVALAHDSAGNPQRAGIESATTDAVATRIGTVSVVVVEDRPRGVTRRHAELELADGTLVPLQGPGADALPAGARVELRGHRDGNSLTVDSARTLAPLAPTDKAVTEVDGTLAILHADYFDDRESRFVYEVHAAGAKVHRLRLGAMPASLAPGMKVRVTGRAESDGETITPERITVLADATATGGAQEVIAAATAHGVLVILANFSNTAAPSFSAPQAQQVMSGNPDSVANFFGEASYGQHLLNVTVTPGWVTMARAQPVSCGTSDWRAIGSGADAAARGLGAAYDPAAYEFVVYVFPATPACGWLGLAYIGSPRKAWINGVGAFRTSTIAHEMGHNFGLLHAASLRCSGAAIGGSCAASEYGDPFDAMGNQRAMHYNAMQKAKLAWIPSASVRTHAGGSALYTLGPLELAGAATYAVKIPTGATNRTYWLEFRQPIGFDAPLASYPNAGAQIRVASPFETMCPGCDSYSDDTQLLDATPGTSAFTDATLLSGQTFSDAAYGVSVTVLSATAGALTVQVGIGGARAVSSVALASSPNPSLAGDAVTLNATVTGVAPTGSVAFSLGGCPAAPLAGTGDARTATCTLTGLAAGTYVVTATYSGDAGNSAATAALTQTVEAAPTAAASIPVYRFYTGTQHFYTGSESEKNYILSTSPGWRYEGIAFYALAAPGPGTWPVYRFNTGAFYFYTIYDVEKNYILANVPGYVLEGVAFNAYVTQFAGTLPVYRFNAGSYYFYTISEFEKNAVLASYPTFKLEGVAFYAKPSP